MCYILEICYLYMLLLFFLFLFALEIFMLKKKHFICFNQDYN